MPSQEEYWQALQARVCSRCLDGDGNGDCRIDAGGFCALKTYFPKILEAINSVYSHSIVPYENELRKRVCGSCKHQRPDGRCMLREEVDCALDRYFPLIVEVIEETQRAAHIKGSQWSKSSGTSL